MFNWFSSTNKNARIRSRVSLNGKLRTETTRRDAGTLNAAVTTDPSTNATRLFLDLDEDKTVALTGHEARTLYRLLQTHYAFTGKSR